MCVCVCVCVCDFLMCLCNHKLTKVWIRILFISHTTLCSYFSYLKMKENKTNEKSARTTFYKGQQNLAPRILNLGTRRRSASLAGRFISREAEPGTLWIESLGGSQNRSESPRMHEHHFSLPENKS